MFSGIIGYSHLRSLQQKVCQIVYLGVFIGVGRMLGVRKGSASDKRPYIYSVTDILLIRALISETK